jgi:2-methylcitrate synthase
MSKQPTKPKPRGGLADIIAGTSAICTVGQEGTGLSYRGYSIEDLALQASFEEVAYLLLYGLLPTQTQLGEYVEDLKSKRALPETLRSLLETIPNTAHPMDVMRSACSYLGCLEPETNFSQQQEIANRLVAIFPSILAYWYRFHHDGERIDTCTEDSSIAGHFLHLLTGQSPNPLHTATLNTSLILYAEHEFNASTFAARVTASTLADFYSAVVSAIGTLRGPLHGGANEAAMELIKRFKSVDEVEAKLKASLANKEKIMGFGHRVYKTSDPRSPIIQGLSNKLAEQHGDKTYYNISERIQEIMWQEKKLFPNLDFYSASAYYFMGIPIELYTPIFICSRITGWAAHIMEQREHNALIRPSSEYNGPQPRDYVSIEQRS